MNRRKEILVAALLLGLTFGLQVMSARTKSATYDEQFYITRGAAFVKLGDLHILIGEPVLLNALNALPLLALPDLQLPVDLPSWASTSFHGVSTDFMWRINDNADQILFLSRVPTMLLTLLLATFVYRWARELFGPWGGMLSLFLCALDPNLIAHGRLAATDLGSTTFILISAYWTWRLLRVPTRRHLLLAGVCFGLAQASRFSALALGPSFALLFLWRAVRRYRFVILVPGLQAWGLRRLIQPWWERLLWLLVAGVSILVMAYLTVWVVHGFQVGPVSAWGSFPVLAPSYFDQLVFILGRLTGQEGREVIGFLAGKLYVGGDPAYFPTAFLLKTPIPTLVLFAGAVIVSLRRRSGKQLQFVWLPAVVFFNVSLFSKLNLGYRYILPVVPFVIVMAGAMGQWVGETLEQARGSRRALAVTASAILVGWSAWSGLAIYPHYLAFFNEWAGGPDNGWRFLVDSNIDWGQDLKGLRRWMDANGVERIKLGYVGEAFPPYYGIDFDPIPSFPDRWEHPLHHELYLNDPAPGLYAISANLIQGRNLADPETYAWFREREPLDKVGYSIFIYDVPRRGASSATIGLSGLVPPDIRPEDYARLGTNDVDVRWFDPAGAAIAPGGDRWTTFLIADGAVVHPALQHLWPWGQGPALASTTRDGRPLALFEGNVGAGLASHVAAIEGESAVWHLPAVRFAAGDPDNHGARLSVPVRFGEPVELLAYEVLPGVGEGGALRPGDTLTLVTYWRVRAANETPLKLFAHLLDADGAFAAGQDRLDVWYENWRPGDLFAQVQEVIAGNDMLPGEYQLEIGWYRPETMERLPVMRDGDRIADRVLLNAVQVGN